MSYHHININHPSGGGYIYFINARGPTNNYRVKLLFGY